MTQSVAVRYYPGVMPGRLDLRELERLVRRGEIDTVLTVFPDGFGRLLGKRAVAGYFLDHLAGEGAHACIYLLTVDMDMEPLPGFRLTSWERGYGDMKLVPDLATLRRIPWLPKTALVFCDVYAEDGTPLEEAPRWVLRRQVERARALGYTVKAAAELELTDEVLDLGGMRVEGPVDLIQNPAATLERGRGDCVALTGLQILGTYGHLWPGSTWAPLKGRLARGYVSAVGTTIAAAATSRALRSPWPNRAALAGPCSTKTIS